jgi:inorganic pyrophosphatase/exopolyphosphatase
MEPQRLFKQWCASCLVGFLLFSNTSLYARSNTVAPADVSVPVASADEVSLRGIKIDKNDPFVFELLISGAKDAQDQAAHIAGERFIQYFLAALTIPAEDSWVNLSPTEPARIIATSFAQTMMGADLLDADALLKKTAAAATSPDTAAGKAYWAAMTPHGNSEVSDVLSKIWIVPERATLRANGNAILIDEATMGLRVGADTDTLDAATKDVIEKTVVPVVKVALDQNADFSRLRNVYRAFVLAHWYKRTFKKSIINKMYSGSSKIAGINTADPHTVDKIFSAYMATFRKGVYDISRKERIDGVIAKRRYFSGGSLLGESTLLEPLFSDVRRLSEGDTGESVVACRFSVSSSTIGAPAPYPEHSDVQLGIKALSMRAFSRILQTYKSAISNHDGITFPFFYAQKEEFIDLLSRMEDELQISIEHFKYGQSHLMREVRHNFLVVTGAMHAAAIAYDDFGYAKRLREMLRRIFAREADALTTADLNAHIRDSWTRFEGALRDGKEVVFVVGHDNPDMDALFSSVAMSLFMDVMYGNEKRVHIPLSWGAVVDQDITTILGKDDTGKDIAASIPAAEQVITRLQEAGKLSSAYWVIVDQNKQKEFFAPFKTRLNMSDESLELIKAHVIEVVDHHEIIGYPYPKASYMVEKAGSTAALVTQLLLGIGAEKTPYQLAKVLAAAIVKDSDNCRSKAFNHSERDKRVLEALTRPHNIYGKSLYTSIRRQYLDDTAAAEVVRRDAKFIAPSEEVFHAIPSLEESRALLSFRFSVDEDRPGLFESDGRVRDAQRYDDIITAEKVLLRSKSLPFSLVKIMDAQQDYDAVNAERILIIANDTQDAPQVDPDVLRKILRAIADLYRKEHVFLGDSLIVDDDAMMITVSGWGEHVQRKEIAPLVTRMLVEHYASSSSSVGGVDLRNDLAVDMVGTDLIDDIRWGTDTADFEGFSGFTYHIDEYSSLLI